MHTLTEEDLLFLLIHYPDLSRKEKWIMAVQLIPDLLEAAPKKGLGHTISSGKRASFLQYIKNAPIMQLKEKYTRRNIRYITLSSPDYPFLLKHTYDPPFVLFYKGNRSLLDMALLGVVGARECSDYGPEVLETILPVLTETSIGIVSGLAKGIDTAAHKQTVELGGKTIAVIGTGLDSFYPRENRKLQTALADCGMVISEYPLGTPPKKHHFPMRNRIIAGLSKGVLVVEAKERSGSLITARMALEEGRDVFAIPGSLFNPLSSGCNELIKLGAVPVTNGADILDEWDSEF